MAISSAARFSRTVAYRSLLLALCLSTHHLNADPELPLPGHNTKLEETVKHCYGALVATFEKEEWSEPGPTGAGDFEIRWKVNQVLRGSYAPETTLSIRVQSLPKSHAESMPTENKTYILIGYGPEIDHQQIAIVLENTPENLEKVKKLLQQ